MPAALLAKSQGLSIGPIDALTVRDSLFKNDRPAVLVKASGPILRHVRLPDKKLARFPIENIVESIPVRNEGHFSLPASNTRVGQHRNLGGIIIPYLVWRELKVPFQRSVGDVECYQRGRVKVVTKPPRTV